MDRANVAIAVHGGAWSIPPAAREPHARGCLAAAERGFAVLEAGGTAVDAVVTAIELLEDDPTFDAGRGSVLSAEGRVQLDAGLMDGRTLHIGAVAGVHRVAHPIQLARAVLERSAHHLLVGEGAERFAREQGIPLVDPDSLVVERERHRHADFIAAGWAPRTTLRTTRWGRWRWMHGGSSPRATAPAASRSAFPDASGTRRSPA